MLCSYPFRCVWGCWTAVHAAALLSPRDSAQIPLFLNCLCCSINTSSNIAVHFVCWEIIITRPKWLCLFDILFSIIFLTDRTSFMVSIKLFFYERLMSVVIQQEIWRRPGPGSAQPPDLCHRSSAQDGPRWGWCSCSTNHHVWEHIVFYLLLTGISP